jgi:hypothetical protein
MNPRQGCCVIIEPMEVLVLSFEILATAAKEAWYV